MSPLLTPGPDNPPQKMGRLLLSEHPWATTLSSLPSLSCFQRKEPLQGHPPPPSSQPALSPTVPFIHDWSLSVNDLHTTSRYKYGTIHDSSWFNLRLFNFTMVWKKYTFGWNYFKFWVVVFSQASNTRHDIPWRRWAEARSHGSQSATQSRGSTIPTLTTLWTHPYTHSVSHFQESINYMVYLILSYKIGFVWEDLARL